MSLVMAWGCLVSHHVDKSVWLSLLIWTLDDTYIYLDTFKYPLVHHKVTQMISTLLAGLKVVMLYRRSVQDV